MVDKLKKSSPGGHEYLLVAIDKFSKWIEAKPVRKADGATTLKFVCSLVTRFGIPRNIITDNGTNFAQGEIKDYCNEVGIRLDLASVAHPQSNDEAVAAAGGGLSIGINYGQIADNLPSPSWVSSLVRSMQVSKVKLYDADQNVLRAFLNTGVEFVIGIGNENVSG
ncbi:hypothetical protein QYE76_043838 [Lolium multiflorum]|uniref:Integrase catalytic domain-containing protein n=1 Tax=Lolium multiflorum TaxID=4521 RepID=A0AAD8THZ8_LOLMU|nr:hypothetical protein QYE76_043838 [Lolium multiflorum]